MHNFIGEIPCTIDEKGRLAIPVKFVRQLPSESSDRLILGMGLDKCLELYSVPEFEKKQRSLENLNPYNEKERLLLRLFARGLTDNTLDGSNRMLIPKRLKDYANLNCKDIILVGQGNKIEIWNANDYDNLFNISAQDVSNLANEILGKVNST